jgi:hypothetical protein
MISREGNGRSPRCHGSRWARPGVSAALNAVAAGLLAFSLLAATMASAVMPVADWEDPPRETRPVARWWWPGGSVEPQSVERHLRAIADAGFGAVELQPLLLGLGDEDLAADSQLRSVGQPAFRERVAHAARTAAKLGLGFDLTLGSGWPGGLPTSRENAERQLLMSSFDVEGPAELKRSLPPAPDQSYRRSVEWVLDTLGPPDPDVRVVTVLAGRVGAKRAGVPTLLDVVDISSHAVSGEIEWSAPEGAWRVFVFYTNSTGHFVMGGAFPGGEEDALVVDHLSKRGADALLEGYGQPVLEACAKGELQTLFVDSFELMGELPYSDDFARAFRGHAGYDLTTHLPLLFRRGGESKYAEMMDLLGRNGGPLYASLDPEEALRVREDYEAVRARLFEEQFVGRLVDWSHARGLELRLQAHGGYGNYLDTYALADVPEAEGLFGHGSFDFLALAGSAAHVAGRRWASSEAFITLRLLGRRLSLDEMRLLAGRAYSAGINRLVFHGVPYPYLRADGVAWYPFSGGFGRILAGPLPMSSEIHAAFLAELGEFNRFLSRLSVAMSHGDPVADIAWMKTDPGYPDTASFQLGRIEAHANESPTTGVLRARGLTHDRVSRRMLTSATLAGGRVQVGVSSYAAVLVDDLDVAEPALASKLVEIAESGIPVLLLGRLPRRAPGLRDFESRDRELALSVERLSAAALRASTPRELEAQLGKRVVPGLVAPLDGERLTVSLQRRVAPGGELLLVANESWQSSETKLRTTKPTGAVWVWDPWTGERTRLHEKLGLGQGVSIRLDPAESLILSFESEP